MRRLAVLVALLPGAGACGDSTPELARLDSAGDTTISPFAIADSLIDEGRAAEALAHLVALRDSFAVVGDTANEWRAEFWRADALITLGRQDSAAAAIAAALALAGDDPVRESWTRNRNSLLLRRRGETDAAIDEAQVALALARTAGARDVEVSTLGGLAAILSNAGRYTEAVATSEGVLALRRERGASPQQLAQALNNLGIEYRHVGRFTDAAAVYDESLALARGLENPILTAMALYNLANVHAAAGDPGRALTLMLESLQLTEAVGDPRGLGFLHGGLANLYRRAGNAGRARAHLDQALEINRASGHVYGEAVALENLGRLEIGMGNTDHAATALLAALALADPADFGRERSTIRAALARAEAARGNAAAALSWAERAVAIADSLAAPEARIEALEARGTAQEAADPEGALESYLEAIDLLESWRGRLALGDLRMGVADRRMAAFEGAIRGSIAAGRPAAALEIAERARARLLRELIAERDAHDGPVERPERELRRELRERYAAWVSARDAAARTTLDREISALTAELTRVESEARRRDPATAAARYPAPATVAAMQAGLTGPDRAVLAFHWGERDVFGWWLSDAGLNAARLGAADSLAPLVDFLRTAIADPAGGDRWSAAARRAFRELIEPLGPAAATEVLVLADGPLAYLPFEVLIPAEAEMPWGATRRFLYAPSASVLLALRETAAPERWQRAVLAVGNPLAERGPPLEALPPLPRAAQEARTIASRFRRDGADLLTGRRATLERWLALEPARYRYLHFAAHARVDDRQPERTHVVLAGAGLDLPAIRRLDLNAELVTLSACETALGRRVRGEGVIGLPHAFLSAGARGVLVALWRIDDRRAADFMRDFYDELYAGRAPADALHVVRRRRIEAGGPAAHPSHWAPFVLVGAG